MGSEGDGSGKKPQQPHWLIYLAILLAGLLMLGQALHWHQIERIPAKLALGLLFSAFALFVGNGRPSGFIATTIIWAAIIISFLV
jgi:hypothetical protein